MKHSPRRWRRDAGATLLEILVVLSIIALLAAVVGPRVVGYLGKAKSTTTELQLDNLKVAVELFYVDVGRYPTEEEGLSALLVAPASTPNWSGPYLDAADALSDPWDRNYVYQAPGEEGRPFTIFSLGRDGAEGGEGEDADLRI
ncbi:MAG: type II secretion system major pseudopilin GspG [Pseudomonadota bacterium]